MHGEITYRILKVIAEAATNFADVCSVIMESPYGSSYGFLERKLSQKRARRTQSDAKAKERQYAQNMIYRLKKDGLITENVRSDVRAFSITPKGKQKMVAFKRVRAHQLPARRYPLKPGTAWTIVAFDIPESEKRKREWLRATLRYLGFHMIQKSVWIAKAKVPEDFIRDLSRMNILSCVEIFEITKTGTLKHIA